VSLSKEHTRWAVLDCFRLSAWGDRSVWKRDDYCRGLSPVDAPCRVDGRDIRAEMFVPDRLSAAMNRKEVACALQQTRKSRVIPPPGFVS
jgi:hypothetical protein